MYNNYAIFFRNIIKKDENMKKEKVIIDTDPGVDDSAAIVLSLEDKKMDIKLFTTVRGNKDIDTVTRNMLHILEKYGRTDIPVAKGAAKAMFRNSPDAEFIHQKYGMGGYIPPEKVKAKPIRKGAIEAMYEVICENKGEINIIALGPHTNLGLLIKKHPDVVGMIKHIYTEGCSPYDWPNQGPMWIHYRSFNASTDPEAVKIVVESGIPMTYIPSRMGRELAYFTEKEVLSMKGINETGKFIHDMYTGYWEHKYADKRVATNDTCAVLACRYPRLFKYVRVDIDVDTEDLPGRTNMTINPKSHIRLAVAIDEEKMKRDFFKGIKKAKTVNEINKKN